MNVRNVSRLLAFVFVASIVGAAGCRSKEAEAWIGEHAAVVRCTQAGRERMPPVLADVPVPAPPTGLFARTLDPMTLDELGYQRDRVACATLEAPDRAHVQRVADSMAALVATYDATSTAVVQTGGRCACDIAHAMGFRELIAVCRRTSTQRGCEDAVATDEMEDAVKPLLAAITQAELPLVHWRLAGRTDRKGWFADRLDTLVDAHPAGSTAYRPGQAVPPRGNHELVRALLQAEHVVAVVRQDAGRALLVAREIGDVLVLDHFAHVTVSPDYEPLLAYLDNAHVDDYLRRLAPPNEQRRTGLDPRAGYLAEVDRALLEDVDALLVAASAFSGARYESSAERRTQPDVLVDRATLQAPFGANGEALVVRLALSDAGQIWAQTLSDDILSPTLDELGLAERGPLHVQPRGQTLPFYLRGTAVDAVLVHGIHSVPSLMRATEMDAPSSVQGRASAWRFELPAREPVPDADANVLRGLRALMAARPYVVTSELDAARTVLRLDVRPR